MTKIFKDGTSYRQELNKVYSFHRKVYNTVLTYLQKHGDYVITEEDNKLERWKFCFLEWEGYYDVKAVCLTEDGKDFYLEAISNSGDNYKVHWDTINYDMIIIDMLMDLVFPYNK